MHVHLVFVTKYRREVFTKEILDDLRPMLASVCRDFEAELVEFDGEDDHVHLLVNYPPKVSVSNLVNSLKGVSSRMIRKKNYPSIRKKLWGGALWSPSYFAGSCGGAPIAVIRQYIEQQQTPPRLRRRALDPALKDPRNRSITRLRSGDRGLDVLRAATVEDTETSEAELRERFGDAVASIVMEVTDDKALPKSRRKEMQVEHAPHKSPGAALVKLADKTCNLRDIAAASPADWPLARRQEYFD
jgi:putative transposase